MNDDLSAFLLARFAEEKRRAEACHDYSECGPENWETAEDGRTYGCPAHPSVARRLAECEAKYEIASRLRAMEAGVLSRGGLNVAISELRQVCEFLAVPYADHEDYREEWKP